MPYFATLKSGALPSFNILVAKMVVLIISTQQGEQTRMHA